MIEPEWVQKVRDNRIRSSERRNCGLFCSSVFCKASCPSAGGETDGMNIEKCSKTSPFSGGGRLRTLRGYLQLCPEKLFSRSQVSRNRRFLFRFESFGVSWWDDMKWVRRWRGHCNRVRSSSEMHFLHRRFSILPLGSNSTLLSDGRNWAVSTALDCSQIGGGGRISSVCIDARRPSCLDTCFLSIQQALSQIDEKNDFLKCSCAYLTCPAPVIDISSTNAKAK